ncbi:MAG: hypothetical protein ACREPG_13720, partial [Candidatus Binatia bacterium]
IAVPFEQLLIFATNLNPADLVDDAFLRRMGYRMYIAAPDKEMYASIYQQYVENNGFLYEPARLEYLFRLYSADNRPLRACEPRDLIQRCADICRYENRDWMITDDLLRLAWHNYFGGVPAA